MATLSNARSLDPAQVPGLGRTVWRSARAAIGGVIAAIEREREVRRLMEELASLDDRTLRDIGLTRGDLGRAVRFGRD
jgi:uncharacterized protein YjiS (DUF1127 family)